MFAKIKTTNIIDEIYHIRKNGGTLDDCPHRVKIRQCADGTWRDYRGPNPPNWALVRIDDEVCDANVLEALKNICVEYLGDIVFFEHEIKSHPMCNIIGLELSLCCCLRRPTLKKLCQEFCRPDLYPL